MSIIGSTKMRVEVCCKHNEKRLDQLQLALDAAIRVYLKARPLRLETTIEISHEDENLCNDVHSLYVETSSVDVGAGDVGNREEINHASLYFYRLNREQMAVEMFGNEDEGDDVPASNHWLLPSAAFMHQWENLIYDYGLKEEILLYGTAALTFALRQVNQSVVSCNRLILLHGPPGTGKTTLCKAIAQKLSIRMRGYFMYTHLFEINSHSLFSRWFSESGKLVMKLFAKIREIITNPRSLVCIIIDEVESLAYARGSMSSEEPKDAIRVVNALLTQLDSIRQHSNVLVLATSNLAHTIDGAFVDRADIVQYIGPPSPSAIRRIYTSMFAELMKAGMITAAQSLDLNTEADFATTLDKLVDRSQGLSGRALRKLPFLAHTLQIARHCRDQLAVSSPQDFLDALLLALEKHKTGHQLLKQTSHPAAAPPSAPPLRD